MATKSQVSGSCPLSVGLGVTSSTTISPNYAITEKNNTTWQQYNSNRGIIIYINTGSLGWKIQYKNSCKKMSNKNIPLRQDDTSSKKFSI